MLKKITLLQKASILLAPLLKIHAMRSCRTNVVISTVELSVDQCLANVSTPTLICCQQLRPLPNVGPLIAF